jgi:hypothetical protein
VPACTISAVEELSSGRGAGGSQEAAEANQRDDQTTPYTDHETTPLVEFRRACFHICVKRDQGRPGCAVGAVG